MVLYYTGVVYRRRLERALSGVRPTGRLLCMEFFQSLSESEMEIMRYV